MSSARINSNPIVVVNFYLHVSAKAMLIECKEACSNQIAKDSVMSVQSNHRCIAESIEHSNAIEFNTIELNHKHQSLGSVSNKWIFLRNAHHLKCAHLLIGHWNNKWRRVNGVSINCLILMLSVCVRVLRRLHNTKPIKVNVDRWNIRISYVSIRQHIYHSMHRVRNVFVKMMLTILCEFEFVEYAYLQN